MPNSRKPPAGTGGISENDLLAGDHPDCMPDLAIVAGGAWRTLTALLLTSPPVSIAKGLLDQLPESVPDAVLGWWIAGIRLSLGAGVIPNPMTAADAAIRAGTEPPPGLRGLVLSSGHDLVAEVSDLPLACCGHMVVIVRAAYARRAAEIAAERIRTVAWTGDLTDLATVVQREAADVLALLAEVNHD